MGLFEKESEDKGFCFCLSSYVGVLVLGSLQVLLTIVCIISLVSRMATVGDEYKLVLFYSSGDSEGEASILVEVYSLAVSIIGLIPFILVLVAQESTFARISLFVTQLVIYVVTILFWTFVTAFLYLIIAVAEPDEFTGKYDHAWYIFFIIAAIGLTAFLLIYGIVGALCMAVYWRFYQNLKGRDKIEHLSGANGKEGSGANDIA